MKTDTNFETKIHTNVNIKINKTKKNDFRNSLQNRKAVITVHDSGTALHTE